MLNDVRRNFPQWVNDTQYQYDMMFSDDIDSFMSVCLLKHLFNFKINYFYDFNNIYRIKKSKNKAIAVDIALKNGRTWDNHVTIFSNNDKVNPLSANLNSVFKISRENYIKKYCGSTLLQIWSFYNFPLPKTEEGRMILLAIDVSFKGYYYSDFKKIHNEWFKILQFEELIDVLNNHTEADFYEIIKKYRLNEKIYLNENKLETKIDLEKIQDLFLFDLSLPEDDFSIFLELERLRPIQLKPEKNYSLKKEIKYFSLALTRKNEVCMTRFRNI